MVEMKKVLVLVVACFCVGCGEKDLNKDLKPVNPNAKLDALDDASGGKSKSVTAPNAPPK